MALDTAINTDGPQAPPEAVQAVLDGAELAPPPAPAPSAGPDQVAALAPQDVGGAVVSDGGIVVTPSEPEISPQDSFGAPAGTQVAGLKETLQTIRNAARRAERNPPLAQPGQPGRLAATEFTLREPTPDELAAFDEATRRTAERIGVVDINIENIADGPAFLENYRNRVAQLHERQIDEARRGVLSWEETLRRASNSGITEMVYEVVRRPIGRAANAEEMVRALVVVQNTDALVSGMARRIQQGTATPAEIQRFPTLVAFYGAVMNSTYGMRAEAGRSLNVLKIMGDITPERVSSLDALTSEIPVAAANMSPADITAMAVAFNSLNAPYQRANMARRSLGARLADVWSELYINSLLSSPVTHIVNSLSNAAYIGIVDPLETGVAAGIGKVKQGLYGMLGRDQGTRVYASEVLAKLSGMMHALPDAMRLAGRAWWHEAPIDPMTGQPMQQAGSGRIDARVTKAITPEAFNLNRDEPLGWTVKWLGYMARVPGRFLIAEDEFFKAIAREAAIRAAIEREMQHEIGNGVAPAQAIGRAARRLANPDLQLIRSGQEAADYLTFQQDLTGFMAQIQGVMSHPALKVAVPFFKTPTNVAAAVMERSPLAILLPQARADIMAGGARADAALARIAVGSSIMASFAWMAGGMADEDMRITGAGPSDKGAREAWTRMGLQPYSFAFRQQDGSWKSYSYSRLDPWSGTLAMAADYAEYGNYHPAADEMEQLMLGGVAGIYNYMSQQPFLQFLFEINSLLGPEYENGEQKAERFLELMGKYGGKAVLVPAPGGGAAVSGVERATDASKSSGKLQPGYTPWGEKITETNPMIRGFYEALNDYKTKNPFFSSDVEPELNLWGEEVKGWDGGAWVLFNPIRIQTGKYRKLDAVIAEMDWMKGPRMPDKKIEGVLLDAAQYNRLIRLANEPDYNTGNTMLDDLHEVVASEDFRTLGLGDRQTLISHIVSQRYSAARKQLIATDPVLKSLIEVRKNTINNYGTARP